MSACGCPNSRQCPPAVPDPAPEELITTVPEPGNTYSCDDPCEEFSFSRVVTFPAVCSIEEYSQLFSSGPYNHARVLESFRLWDMFPIVAMEDEDCPMGCRTPRIYDEDADAKLTIGPYDVDTVVVALTRLMVQDFLRIGSQSLPECNAVEFQVTPSIISDTKSWFDSEADFPAGNYKIRYVEGALKYGGFFKYQLQRADGHGFRVVYNDGASDIEGPFTSTNSYDTQAEVEDANEDAEITFFHNGGKIGVYLLDYPYADNRSGDPNPTFELLLVNEEPVDEPAPVQVVPANTVLYNLPAGETVDLKVYDTDGAWAWADGYVGVKPAEDQISCGQADLWYNTEQCCEGDAAVCIQAGTIVSAVSQSGANESAAAQLGSRCDDPPPVPTCDSGSNPRYWWDLWSSSSGLVLGATNGPTGIPQISNDFGDSWSNTHEQNVWLKASGTPNASTIAIIKYSGTVGVPSVFKSTDMGANWSSVSNPSGSIFPGGIVAVVSDSVFLLTTSFATSNGQVYRTSNGGSSWSVVVSGGKDWRDMQVARSATSKLIAVASGQSIHTSTDSGATWTERATAIQWTRCAISDDGTIMYASSTTGLYKSTDSGVNWSLLGSMSGDIKCVSTSSNGTVVAVAIDGEPIQVSEDGGSTWEDRCDARDWALTLVSPDGTEVLAARIKGSELPVYKITV